MDQPWNYGNNLVTLLHGKRCGRRWGKLHMFGSIQFCASMICRHTLSRLRSATTKSVPFSYILKLTYLSTYLLHRRPHKPSLIFLSSLSKNLSHPHRKPSRSLYLNSYQLISCRSFCQKKKRDKKNSKVLRTND